MRIQFQAPQSRSMADLDDDVLDLLAEAAHAARSIVPLLGTCKRIRSRCLPIAFNEFTYKTFVRLRPTDADFVWLPQTLWQYIRVLHFIDFCGDVPGRGMDEKSMEWQSISRSYLRWTKDMHLCGVYVSQSLASALLQMPHLRKVTFRFPSLAFAHGLPWPVLKHILSLPHLKEFSLDMYRFAPKLSTGEELILDSPTSLVSFSHKLSDYHERSEIFPTERRALELVLDINSSTLQQLTLAMELAPLNLLCDSSRWSNLRELCLRGQYPTIDDPPLPLIVVFAHMTNLRVLEFKFMQPRNLDPQPIWPSGHAGVWPWPSLEELTVSCPQVDDNIYDALPNTLRSLSLRYTPHYLNHIWKKKFGLPLYADCVWRWPLVSSTDVLHILRRCEVTVYHLRHLELEYTVDDSEADLLRYVAMAFPDLRSLHLFRCRPDRVEPEEAIELSNNLAYVERLIEPLASLQSLERVKLSLDLPGTPQPRYTLALKFGLDGPYNIEELQSFIRGLHSIADVVARMLGPRMQEIRLWKPDLTAAFTWLVYGVARGDGSPRARLDRMLPANYAGY
ncbi:hypothetical protein C8Q73DRAFT_718074 [Cubamyces lactineus]|nr:hypothetical protein C8Q73DRAFT_718074 [Cubamyces lactineus]